MFCWIVKQKKLIEEAKGCASIQLINEVPFEIPEAPPIPEQFPKKCVLQAQSQVYLDLPDEFDPFKLPYQLRNKVKEKFKNYFGGRECVLAVGGAAVPKELKKFMMFCFDAVVSEGYGTTEVCRLEYVH